jgi:AcrR family transcriptional regulator
LATGTKREKPRTGDAEIADEDDSKVVEVKSRIYATALELFSRKGYDAVSVREICVQAQTTAPMLYYYFRNKKGLYRYILGQASRLRKRALDKALKETGGPQTRLRSVLEAWGGLGAEDDPESHQARFFYLREVFGMGPEGYKTSVESFDRQMRHALRDIVQEGIDEGVFRPVRAEMAALAIIGIMNTFIRRLALGAPLSMEDGIEQVTDTFMYGLLVRAPSETERQRTMAGTA